MQLALEELLQVLLRLRRVLIRERLLRLLVERHRLTSHLNRFQCLLN
jgi:hypothetical protein